MSDRSDERAMIDRDALDARIAFVSAAFLLAYGFAALLDRIGAPERFVAAAPPYVTVLGLATLGFLLHSMRASTYYAAGRALPAAYAGFANAAIVVALLTPFAAQLAGRGWTFGLVGGAFVGLAGAAFYLGPLLRKTGAFTVSDLLAARFPDLGPRLALIGAAALSSALIAIAGVGVGVDALVDLTGASRGFAAFFICASALVIAGPGGLAGVVWCAAATAGVAALGFGWPIIALVSRGEMPVGLFGGRGWIEAGQMLHRWDATSTPANFGMEIGVTVAVALGVAALSPVLAPFITTHDEKAARRAGYAALLWSLTLGLFAAAIIGASALTLARRVEGQSAERLPTAIYGASGRGLVNICGVAARGPSEAQRACAKQGVAPGEPLSAERVRPAEDYLLGSLSSWADLGAAASGLLASAAVALGLALAAAGLQACATAVGHDALYRLRGEIDLTSRRLAITRLTLVVVGAVASYAAAIRGAAPGALIAVALAVSASCIAPLVALAFWRRAGNREALAAITGGTIGLALALLAMDGAQQVEAIAFAGLAGAALALASGVVSGLVAGEDRPEAQAFILRMLRGDAQMVGPDKGA